MRSFGYAVVGAVLMHGAVAASEEVSDIGSENRQSPSAVAETSTVHRHFGFFLRLDTGPAYTWSSEQAGSFNGGGWDFGLSIGGALGEDNILAGHLFYAVTSVGSSSSSTSLFALAGFGPEYTHYFMPANLYLSGSILLTRAAVSSSNGSTTVAAATSAGFGLKIVFGKEWWVGDHWGIGVAAHYEASWNQDGSDNLQSNGLSLNFSATYN